MTSWVIYDKNDNVWFETFFKTNVEKAKAHNLKVVPIAEYLGNLNKQIKGEVK